MEGHQERAAGAAPFEEGIGGNFSHNMNDNIEVMEEIEDQEESGVNTGESGKGKRKKRSPVWKYFTELSIVHPPEGDGKKRAECKKCKVVYICDQNHGTSNMRNHIPKCRGLTEKEIQDLMLKGIEESLSAQPSVRFDPEKFRELLVLAIIRHNLPFTFVEYAGIRDLFACVNPDIKLVCRNTAKADVVKIYHEQKILLKNLLQHISSRISLTSDLWTSTAQDGYFCLTAHYIDSEWKLQHKILSFSIMPTPHNGVNLCEKLHNILTEWGIDKRLFSLTLDNASANDVSVDLLKGQLNNRHALLCEGDFFHMRCCAHIINLIVQDGLKEMEMAICKVRESVRYVRGSQTRRQKFLDCIAQVSLQSAKGFRQDVPTRWNSTFLMLESALYYRRALVLLEMSDSNYTYCPSVEEWDRVENVNKFLRVFFEVTSIFYGTNYPTSNLYFPQVFFIQFTISNAMKGHDSYIQQMATRMNAKFEKYWSEYNPLLAIACILDPRYKLQFVEYAYKKLYGDSEGSRMIRSVRGKLFSLFENYVSPFASNVASSSGSSQQSELDSMSLSHGHSADFYNMMQGFDDYESQEFLMTRKSELEMYLDDIKVPRNSQLDVLAFWKTNEYRYPELSKMARDIFAIPISTVASESAFNIGGRILDEHRSVLKPPIVEALICTRDWLYNEKVKPEEKLEVLTEDVFSSNLNNEAQTIWYWTESFVQWSPLGTYLATVHRQGAAVWGGANSFNRLMRYAHPQVKLIDFSPGEKYLVTYSSHEPSNPRDTHRVVLNIFDVRTGKVMRDFKGNADEFSTGGSGGVSGVSWPVFRWGGGKDDRYFARIGKNVISVYETEMFSLIDKKSLKVENVLDFTWSPTDPILALFVPELGGGNQPARVSLVQIPGKEELRQKNLFSVSDCKMYWQSNGEYLAVKVDRYTKTKKSTYTGFELFRIKERDIPIEVLELDNKNDKIIAFAWEPKGHRFAVIHGDGPRPDISFYSMRTSQNAGRVSKLTTLKAKQANALYWSPGGRFIVLAGLKGFNGQLEFYNVDELETMATGEHFMATDIEWDPTGRYVATSVTSVHEMENGFHIWSFNGKLLYRIPKDHFFQFLWRPRPPSLLTAEKEEEIAKNLKKYSKKYELEDQDVSLQLSEQERKRRKTLQEEWDAWVKEWKRLHEEEKELRKELRDGEASDEEEEYEAKEVEVEEIVDVSEEIVQSEFE